MDRPFKLSTRMSRGISAATAVIASLAFILLLYGLTAQHESEDDSADRAAATQTLPEPAASAAPTAVPAGSRG